MTLDINTIQDVANDVNIDNPVEERVTSSGFVANRIGSTFVGVAEEGDTYIVAEITPKSEVIGRHEARVKVQEIDYVEVVLYRMGLVGEDDAEEMSRKAYKRIRENDYIEKIGKGYINGWRLEPLSSVLEENFKYHELYNTQSKEAL